MIIMSLEPSSVINLVTFSLSCLCQMLTTSLAALCPHYHIPTTKLPWKQFDKVTAKEHLHIENWLNIMIPPGPNFDLRKLNPSELQVLVGPYLAAVKTGNDMVGTTFIIKKWTWGMSHVLQFLTYIDIVTPQNKSKCWILILKKAKYH